MYPNDQQPPLDYLNQIAPQASKKVNFTTKKLIILGGIGIIVIIAIIAIINILSGGVKPTERLAARLMTTESIMDGAASKIKNSQLRTFNGNLKIYLTNTIRDIDPLLVKEKINIKKLSASATSAESGTKTLAVLEDARLNAVYDRTYAREMSYRLDAIMALMSQIDESAGSKELKTFLEDAIENLAPTQKQFADFNAANS